jgi:hypothetical protein
MDSFSAEATQSWFVGKVAVALIPVVILTTADVIGWLMRTLRRLTEKTPQSEPKSRHALHGDAGWDGF